MSRLQKSILLILIFTVIIVVLVKAIPWMLSLLFQLGNPFGVARP